jgi:hypothetical protein
MFMSLIAHADHPELFFVGVLTGVAVVLMHMAWKKIRARK